MNDPKTAGEEVEDVTEEIISGASPFEEDDDAGTEPAGRDGHEALGDDESFSA